MIFPLALLFYYICNYTYAFILQLCLGGGGGGGGGEGGQKGRLAGLDGGGGFPCLSIPESCCYIYITHERHSI